MKKAGIGGAIFLTVNVGVPRPEKPVEFMSAEWQALYAHAVKEADRLGLAISLGVGPGWSGDGGPWLKPDQTMQHLVGSATPVHGGGAVDIALPQPAPRDPFFGRGGLAPRMLQTWQSFYRDEFVIAYPTVAGAADVSEIEEKALFKRAPYSSSTVRPYLAAIANPPAAPADACLDPARAIDLTAKLGADGHLKWDAPPGEWTVYRFGRTLTGQNTRPAPDAGLGFESDKFSAAALAAQADAFLKPLIAEAGRASAPGRGLTTLHLDSWESGSQNWSEQFRREFIARRGYDPLPYLPAILGRFVKDAGTTERFLWDLRQTSRELVRDNHMKPLQDLAHKNGLLFTTEGYDMNPAGDLMMLGAADVQMGEFWSKGFGFKSEYSVIEATSAAHTKGQPIVGAESFTADENERWQQYPARMKAQTDWALAAGINWFVIHRYQHQPSLDQFSGQRMGPYGVSWERTQTWWDMVPAYHTYLARCSAMLQQGRPVADVLYLSPEGAPHVFRPPASAMKGDPGDRRGYNFDGVDPDLLIAHASVKDGRVMLDGGASYGVLVLPRFDTMTPALLRKIHELAEAGATIIGPRPRKSPSLAGYPACDAEIESITATMWGDEPSRRVGRGQVINDSVVITDDKPTANPAVWPDLYADYYTTARVLNDAKISPDFECDADLRYIHRVDGATEFYFVSNPSDHAVAANCTFRVAGRQPEWWDAVTGERRTLQEYTATDGRTTVSLKLVPTGSGFVVFREVPGATTLAKMQNATQTTPVTIPGPWRVAFDPKWGGPADATFAMLDDWSKRPEPGIKGYSGKAIYRTTFDASAAVTAPSDGKTILSLGDVHAMASVKLNGHDLGIVWCPPWELAVPPDLLRATGNELEVTVANLWINRLITDAGLPESQRLTKTTSNPYKADSPLQPSGLLGPVRLIVRTP